MPAPGHEPGPPRRRTVLLALIVALVVIAFIVAHLTGVIGAGSR